MATNDLATTEHAIDLHLAQLVRQHPMQAFIESAPGIGLRGFGRLLGATGSLDRFATVSRLWAYLGMHVVDGSAFRAAEDDLSPAEFERRARPNTIAA